MYCLQNPAPRLPLPSHLCRCLQFRVILLTPNPKARVRTKQRLSRNNFHYISSIPTSTKVVDITSDNQLHLRYTPPLSEDDTFDNRPQDTVSFTRACYRNSNIPENPASNSLLTSFAIGIQEDYIMGLRSLPARLSQAMPGMTVFKSQEMAHG